MIKIFITTIEKEEIKKKHIDKLVNGSKFFKLFLNELLTNNFALNFFQKNIEKMEKGNMKDDLKKDIELLKKGININNYNYKDEQEFKGLKNIFIAEKKELDEIIRAFDGKDTYPLELKSLIDFFHSYYKKFRSWRGSWGGAFLVSALNVRTCIYCNSSYVYTYTNNKNSLKTIAELDHYYSKDKYFYLAMSIFNLFPSCSNCNRIKSSKSEIIMYPYEEGMEGLAKFCIDRTEEFINELSKIHPDKEKIKIKIKNFSKNKQVDNWNKVFCLEERYQSYKTEVSEILIKNKIYKIDKLKEISNLVGLDIETLKDILFDCRQDERQYKDKILSKFTSDILKDIEKINFIDNN